MAYTLPQGDPSLPALPAPLFGDVSAARGDHLRANNNFIWQDLTALAALFDAAGKALDSAKIAGNSIGNASGNVPLNNSVENVGLKAQTARALYNKNSSAETSILVLSVTDLATQGAHYYTIQNTDPAAPWNVTSRCIAVGDTTNAKLFAWQYNTKASAVRNRISGTWEAEWTYLTDDDGNATNADSLGGVAAAFYTGYINTGATPSQSGSMTKGVSYTAQHSGYILFQAGSTGAGDFRFSVGSIRVLQGCVNTSTDDPTFCFPIKTGQTFRVDGSGVDGGYFWIYPTLA